MFFALIVNGVVFQVFGLDPTSFFHNDMNWVPIPEGLPVAQGWTYSAGVFTAPVPPPGPTLAQQAAIMLGNGLTITSTATPALNGTYGTDNNSTGDLSALETGLNAGQGFPPNNATTFAYPDMAGVFHVFGSTDFTNLAAAIRNFVYICKAVISGGVTELPPNTATIP